MSHPSPAELERKAKMLTQQADMLSAQKKFGQSGQKHKEATRLQEQAQKLRDQGYPFDVADGKRATSRNAASKMRKKVGRFHLMVLDALKLRPMTNSEIFDHYRRVHDSQDYYALRDLERSLQPRPGELELVGRVKNTGEKRKNRNGNPELIWSAVA